MGTEHFGNHKWSFQQDWAPAHKVKMTQEWWKRNFANYITSEEWLPYSPDLNSMDFSIWSILQASECSEPHKSLESLKQSLQAEW